MGILGLMPRPYCSFVLSKIVESVYTYAVTNVRVSRKGNIGPVLFEKEKSINDPKYHGIDLHDKEEKFVFNSPISWHPNNLKAIWPETERGTSNRRLRKLEIINYTPSEYPKIENTTDNVPYALDMSEMDKISMETETKGTIKGKHSGKPNALSIHDYLLKNKISVRYISPDFLRITAGTRGENDILKTKLEAAINETGIH